MFSFDEDSEQIFDYPVLCRTDIGSRSENQDTCACWQNAEWLVALVADGAGGHAGGKEASRIAVSGLMAALQSKPSLQPEVLKSRVLEVNEDILEAQRTDASLQGMHTTIVGLVVHKTSGLYTVFHCGDSRAYSCLDGSLKLLTRDHSLRCLMEASQAGAAGEMDPDPMPAPARHLLASALGEESDRLMVDVSVPAFFPAGTLFMLCTDGFWEPFEEGLRGGLECSLECGPTGNMAALPNSMQTTLGGEQDVLFAEGFIEAPQESSNQLLSLACIDRQFNQLIENQSAGSDNLSVLAVAV